MDTTDLMEPGLAEDSTMMDATMTADLDTSIDDLFGEPTDVLATSTLGVALPTMPLPPELVIRVSNMQTRGCCTELAWANTGSIAQIVDNGAKITFRAISRNTSTGIWSLLDESKFPLLPSDGARWEHIKFSNIGVDLAATDTYGRVFIFTLTGALGKMPQAPDEIARPDHPRPNLDAVVGLHWMPMFPAEFRFPHVSAATKIGERWSTELRLRDKDEQLVHHPVDGRQALLYVTRNAKLTLMFQMDGREPGRPAWHAVDSRLEDVSSTTDLITHAAMTEEDDHLLLVTHSTSKCLKLYSVHIEWNVGQAPRPGAPSMLTMVNPTVTTKHLTFIEHATPQHVEAARLSELRLVAAIPGNASLSGVTTSPTIFATFTRALLPMDVTQQSQEAYSVISRWHVESVVPALHETFRKLKVNGTITTPQTTATQLERQEDIFTSKIVLSFEPQFFNTMLAFAASDGTVEFRDRVTMASIEPYPDTTTVTSLSQSGFEHLMDQHFVHVAISGDGGSLVAVKPNGEMLYKTMALRYSWQPIMDDGGLLEAAVVCLARQYTILTCTNISNDENLAILPLTIGAEMRSRFVKEVIRMLRRNLDISMKDIQQQQVLTAKESLLPKAMSAQIVLGRIPGTVAWNPAGKFAVSFLNIRLVASALTWVFQKPERPELGLRPELLVSLRGLVRWASDFLIYITQCLILLKRRRDAGPNEPIGTTCEAFTSDLTNPVLYLLLCSFSRTYLRFLAMGIPRYRSAVQKVLAVVRSASERQQLMEIHDMALSLPFKYPDYEKFILDIDTSIRDAYVQGAVSEPRRAEIELSTITCDGPIAPELHPALTDICDSALPALLGKMDLAKVEFWDTAWLGVEKQSERLRYDVIRKVPLTRGMKLRVCRRCGAYMEDLSMEKMRDMVPTMAHLSRYCVCADYWTLE